MKTSTHHGIFGLAFICGLAALAFRFAGPASAAPSANTTPSPNSFVLAPGEGRTQPLNVLGEPVLVKTSGADTGGRYAVFQLTVPPGSGPPLHRHTLEDETFYVLEGTLTFQIDGKRIVAPTGTTVYAARTTVHTFQNFSSTNVRLIIIAVPAGLDDLFAELSAAAAGNPPPSRAQLEALNLKHGVTILGSPLSASGP